MKVSVDGFEAHPRSSVNLVAYVVPERFSLGGPNYPMVAVNWLLPYGLGLS